MKTIVIGNLSGGGEGGGSASGFNFIVDSNETLAQLAACTDGSLKSVLIKAGTYQLSGKTIDLQAAGTNFVYAEAGSEINMQGVLKGIVTSSGHQAVVIGMKVNVNASSGIESVFGAGLVCINCVAGGTISGGVTGVFDRCTTIDCKSTVSAGGIKTDFNFCKGVMAYSFDTDTATLTISTNN